MALFDQDKRTLTAPHGIFQKIAMLHGNLSAENWASVARRDRAVTPSLRLLGAAIRLGRATERRIDATAEGTIVALILTGFVVLWMIFWAVTTAPLDIHADAGEASV